MTDEPVGASRTTLTWGGAGLVLGTVVPIVAEVGWIFPPPGTSWLYFASTPFFGTASAAILVIAFVLLGFGVRGERGIAGSSRAGRAALVLFALTTVVSAGYVSLNLTAVGVNTGLLAVLSILLWTVGLARVAALVVAAVSVFRAGVVMGPARWALPVVALILAVVIVVSRIPLPAMPGLWLWGLVAVPSGLLLTGVLFLVQGLRSPRELEAPAVSEG